MSELYKQGLNRNQQLLLPSSVDDYIEEDNSVKAIDAYVELLDLSKLEFSNTRKSKTKLYKWVGLKKTNKKTAKLWGTHFWLICNRIRKSQKTKIYR